MKRKLPRTLLLQHSTYRCTTQFGIDSLTRKMKQCLKSLANGLETVPRDIFYALTATSDFFMEEERN